MEPRHINELRLIFQSLILDDVDVTIEQFPPMVGFMVDIVATAPDTAPRPIATVIVTSGQHDAGIPDGLFDAPHFITYPVGMMTEKLISGGWNRGIVHDTRGFTLMREINSNIYSFVTVVFH